MKKNRTIKVCPTGDFWMDQTVPQIRLQGKWLANAGIAPEMYVRVKNPSPGVLIVRRIPAGESSCTA
jgi:hypothetical protein